MREHGLSSAVKHSDNVRHLLYFLLPLSVIRTKVCLLSFTEPVKAEALIGSVFLRRLINRIYLRVLLRLGVMGLTARHCALTHNAKICSRVSGHVSVKPTLRISLSFVSFIKAVLSSGKCSFRKGVLKESSCAVLRVQHSECCCSFFCREDKPWMC